MIKILITILLLINAPLAFGAPRQQLDDGNGNIMGTSTNPVHVNCVSGCGGGSGTPGGSNTNVQYNSSSSFAGNSGFVYDGTNVGVGTTIPGSTLDVSGNVQIDGNGSSTGLLKFPGTPYNFSLQNTGAGYLLIGTDNNVIQGLNNYGTFFDGFGQFFGAPDQAAVSIQQFGASAALSVIGNVGIGSTNPGQILDVKGTIRMTGFNLNLGSSLNNKILTSDAFGNGTWTTPSGGGTPGGSPHQLQYNNGGVFGGVTSSGVIGGNIGIGTSSPIYPLEIHNNISSGSLWTQLNLDNTADYISGFNLSSAGNAVWGVYRYGSGNNNAFCIGQNNISEPVCVTQPTSGNGLTVGLGSNGVSESSGISSGGNIQTNADLLAGISADENSGYFGGDSFIESGQSWQGSNITLLNLTSQDSINTTGNNPWGMAFKVDADGNDNPMTTISSSQFGVATLPLWIDEQGSPVLIGGNPPTWDGTSTFQVQGVTSLDNGLVLTTGSGGVTMQDLITNGISTSSFQLSSSPTNGYVLTSDASGNGTWHVPSSGGSGTVTSIVAGSGLTGGTITTSGTIALDLTHANTWTGQQIFNTANVGIGSTAPGQKLDVTGTVRATAFIKTGGTSSQFLKADGSVDSSAYITGNQSITLSGDTTGSGTTAITTTLKNTGTSGTYRSTTFDAQGRETSGTNPTTFSGYGISDTSANLASALTDEVGTGLAVFNASPNFTGNVGIGTTITGAALSVMNGNVGIGTWVPGSALSVQGNISIGSTNAPQTLTLTTQSGIGPNFSLNGLQSAGSNIEFAQTTSTNGIGAGFFEFLGAGAPTTNPSMTIIESTNNVSVGTFGNTNKLDVSTTESIGYGGGTIPAAPTTGLLVNGNVGIGSITPGQKLDVKGTIRMTGFNLLTSPTNGYVLSSDGFGNGTWTSPSGSGSEQTISYQPGLLSAVNSTIGVYGKFAKTSTVDNIIGSAVTFSCLANPTITMDECGTSTSCASPIVIGTVTVTAAGTAFSGTVSNPTITAGDYVGWAITAGTCASIDISGTAQIHAN